MAAGEFRGYAARLLRRARLDVLERRAAAGLFFGLLPAFLFAALAGTFRLPVPASAAAAALAVVGLAAGVGSALASRTDRRRLLLQADAVLGSREIIATAAELDGKPGGTFTAAIMEEAAGLLAGTAPRVILGPRRLSFAPFALLAAVLTAAAILYPVDLRTLFPPPGGQERDLAQIGEDLRKNGEKLGEEARARELGRTLELSEQLAQLGKDLTARRITPEDALDRMSDLESGLAQEYQLRMQQVQPDARPGQPGSGPGQPGGPGGQTPPKPGAEGGTDSGTQPDDNALNELGDALNRLRRAQRDMGGGQGGAGDQAQAPSRPLRQRDPQAAPGSQDAPPGSADTGQQPPGSPDRGPGGGGEGSGGQEKPGDSGGSGVGTLPAPQKRGPASAITQGGQGPGLQAQGSPAEGDSTKLLARALPEWTGSRLPEEAILNQYSRQAESALARDEIPLKLRQSVKEYFTTIGISK
jgi:hypothetical protein